MKSTTKPTPKLSDLLAQLYKLLESPTRWTTGCLAKDRFGNNVSFHSPQATCFCLLGGIGKVTSTAIGGAGYSTIAATEVGKLIEGAIQGYRRRPHDAAASVVIHSFNDSTSRKNHSRVLEVIEIARQHALGAGI